MNETNVTVNIPIDEYRQLLNHANKLHEIITQKTVVACYVSENMDTIYFFDTLDKVTKVLMDENKWLRKENINLKSRNLWQRIFNIKP